MYKQFARYSTAVLGVAFFTGIVFISIPAIPTEPIRLDPAVKEKCLNILRQGLRSDEFWPSMHAAEALTLAGLGEEVKLNVLARIPRETDDQRRCGLAREMVRAGDRSHVTTMLKILNSENPHGHVHACESLFKVIEIGDGQALRKVFASDSNVTKVLMAAGALARSGNHAAMARIRKELSNESADFARIAAWLMGAM